MKQHLADIKYVIIVFFIFFMCYGISWSQGTDFQYRQRKMYVGFTLLTTQTSISNNGVYNSSNLKQTPGLNINEAVEIGFRLSKYFSLSTGFAYSSYSTSLGMSEYNNSYDSIDSENDNFEMRIVGSGIVEKQKVTYLSLPLKIQFQFLFNKKFGVFLNSGIMVSLPVSKNYSGSGIFDYNGYYPDYNITLYNLPDYGFPENVNLKKKGTLNLTDHNFNFISSAGFTFKVNPLIGLSLGLYYDQSLASISNYTPDNFHLTRKSGDYNSLMSSTSDASLRAIGTALSVYFYLK
jgi:hypothetical protein